MKVYASGAFYLSGPLRNHTGADSNELSRGPYYDPRDIPGLRGCAVSRCIQNALWFRGSGLRRFFGSIHVCMYVCVYIYEAGTFTYNVSIVFCVNTHLRNHVARTLRVRLGA